jgi:hypothetical protein
VSDVAHKAPTFFALYSEGQVTPRANRRLRRSLAGVGQSRDARTARVPWSDAGRIDVLMMTRRTLPLILAARRADRPPREFVEPFFEMLIAGNDPNDKPTLYRTSFWLYGRPPTT